MLVRPGLVPARACAALRRAALAAPREPSRVWESLGPYRLRRGRRRSSRAALAPEAARPLDEALEAVRGKLSAFFGARLAPHEPAQFLVYRAGDFFKPHRDASPRRSLSASRRAVSAVVLLSPPRAYAGGRLALYGLLGEGRAARLGVPLRPREGTLVAFRADLLHEVERVLRGTRVAAAAWYALKPGRGRPGA